MPAGESWSSPKAMMPDLGHPRTKCEESAAAVNDLKRVSGLAILFLVVLRMAIGWQFLYEGMWKLDTFDTARPWSSAGYLKNAQGPLRDKFREATGDPDD